MQAQLACLSRRIALQELVSNHADALNSPSDIQSDPYPITSHLVASDAGDRSHNPKPPIDDKTLKATKSFGDQELHAQLTLLREINCQTAADEETASRLGPCVLSSGTVRSCKLDKRGSQSPSPPLPYFRSPPSLPPPSLRPSVPSHFALILVFPLLYRFSTAASPLSCGCISSSPSIAP